MSSSIHIAKVSTGSFLHNDRSMKVSYLIDSSDKNECTLSADKAINNFNDLKLEAQKNYTNRTKQKMQKSTIFLKEAIVNLEEHHTLKDLEPIKEKLESYGFKVLQMSVHRDEGFVNTDNKKEKNYHAHITMFNLNVESGKSIKFGKNYRTELSKLQTFVADTLKMERGKVSVKEHAKELNVKVEKASTRLDTHDYKKAMKIKEVALQEQEQIFKKENKYNFKEMQKEISSLDTENKELKKELHKLNSSVKNNNADYTELQDKLLQTKKELIEARESTNTKENELGQVQSDLKAVKKTEIIATADIKIEEPVTQQEFDNTKKGMFKKPDADEISELLIRESAKVQRLNTQIINAQKANVSTVEVVTELKDTKKKLSQILEISRNRKVELEELNQDFIRTGLDSQNKIDSLEDDLNNLKSENTKLKNQPTEVKEVIKTVENPLNVGLLRENRELKEENTELKEQQSSTLEKLKDSDKQLISQRETILKQNSTIDTLKQDLSAVRANLKTLKNSFDKIYDALGFKTKKTFEAGVSSILERVQELQLHFTKQTSEATRENAVIDDYLEEGNKEILNDFINYSKNEDLISSELSSELLEKENIEHLAAANLMFENRIEIKSIEDIEKMNETIKDTLEMSNAQNLDFENLMQNVIKNLKQNEQENYRSLSR